MQDKVTYEFAIIRLIPKVEREEFINVGVLLFSKRKSYLGMRYHIDRERIKAFCSSVDIELVESYLKAWNAVCRGGKEAGRIGEMELPLRFRWLAANRSTILQCSPTHPGICQEPEKIISELYDFYVCTKAK